MKYQFRLVWFNDLTYCKIDVEPLLISHHSFILKNLTHQQFPFHCDFDLTLTFLVFFYKQTSHDPTAYVQRARVTRAAPPKPACNPLQFIQIKPCNLYQSAQEQLKKAEEVKKIKETKKEEPEDWQSVSISIENQIFNEHKKGVKSRSMK